MSKREETTKENEILEILRQDHQRVKELFSRFEQEQAENEEEENARLVRDIGVEIMVHAALEEEIFYPAAAEALGEEALVDQALVEHQAARTLVDQLAMEEPDEEMWTARVHVLGEYVAHHIGEEENAIFPRLQQAGFDSGELAKQFVDRKMALLKKAENLELKDLCTLSAGGGRKEQA